MGGHNYKIDCTGVNRAKQEKKRGELTAHSTCVSCFVELLFSLHGLVSWLPGEMYFFRHPGQNNLRNTVGQGSRDLACGNVLRGKTGSEGDSSDGFLVNSE